MRGIVYKSTGSWYLLKTETGNFLNTRIKGIFKIDDITSTNPIAVGDEVEFELENETTGTGIITGISERRNYIARRSPHHKKQQHIVASNLDQVLLFATLKEPRTSHGFIDRFLVCAEAYHIPAVIIFNKADVYKKKELDKYQVLKTIYSNIGYKVFLTSMDTKEGLNELKDILKNKTTLLAGHSGVGKSTFINLILPESNLAIREVSNWSGKGVHTTTFAEMFAMPFGGSIIDTPGIKEFGITGITRQELSHYFPEMRQLIQQCRFNNCLHVNEPGCAVSEAAENGKISEQRYISYCNILNTMTDSDY